jgi:hypothetical protein
MQSATFLRSKALPPAASGVLFVLLFPVLDIFTHPVSVMHGHYVPLIIRLSDFYWHTPILSIALAGTPILLVGLLLLVQWRQFGLVRSALLVILPFILALLVQYFIAVQLDKYLVAFPAAGLAIPWEHVFQFPFIVGCQQLLLIYVSIAAVLWLIIWLSRRVVGFALTKCSQPLTGA